MTDDEPTLSRRSILRNGAVATGALAAGGAVTGSVSGGLSSSAATSNKRGGRAQVDEEPDRNRPFTLSSMPESATRAASCMSGESADQTYLLYDIQYCDSDDDESDASMYVIPNEAELVQDETYVIRSIQECKANGNYKVAFGPARESC
ncbi:hypothetical protein HWV07_05250 [Natronomonas salina]|uniref:hypothetical protein n=1 Tax=Natronomonas salina TaxID=1710540 RepID=UPI0015B6BEA1|nr:hypothetical protein [Natronomonas salina]QLD88470.1 hypothetical protein HWV07_05250 [Natronomonas salina]